MDDFQNRSALNSVYNEVGNERIESSSRKFKLPKLELREFDGDNK